MITKSDRECIHYIADRVKPATTFQDVLQDSRHFLVMREIADLLNVKIREAVKADLKRYMGLPLEVKQQLLEAVKLNDVEINAVAQFLDSPADDIDISINITDDDPEELDDRLIARLSSDLEPSLSEHDVLPRLVRN